MAEELSQQEKIDILTIIQVSLGKIETKVDMLVDNMEDLYTYTHDNVHTIKGDISGLSMSVRAFEIEKQGSEKSRNFYMSIGGTILSTFIIGIGILIWEMIKNK